MIKKLFLLTLLLAAAQCYAGYSAYELIDSSQCIRLTLTTDAFWPEPESKDATDAYREYLKLNSINKEALWGLYDHQNGAQYWADCKWQPTSVSCIVVGGLPYKSFECKFGKSQIWSRTCNVVTSGQSALKIYSVDTAEYEDEGQPFINQYLEKDQIAMKRRCKPRSASSPPAQ